MLITEPEGEQASSQGDTEPLAFDEEADAEGEMDEDQEMLEADATKVLMTSPSSQAAARGVSDPRYVSVEMQDTAADGQVEAESGANEDDAHLDGNEDGDEDAMGSEDDNHEVHEDDAPSMSQTTTGNVSPSKIGATFSDESELTDEPDEDDEDAVGEEEDDDEEGDDEAEDDDEGDEDEAAKGLAALTSGQTVNLDGSSVDTNTGLEGLAVLAAAEAEEDSQGEEYTDNDSVAEVQTRNQSRKAPSAIPRRTATRLNEVIVASPQLSEEEDEEEDEAEESGVNDQESLLKSVSNSSKGNRTLSSVIATKRYPKSGATGLLAGAPLITVEGSGSGLPSAATSREVSPVQDDSEERRLNEENKSDLDQEKDEVGTPVQELDEAQVEEESTTDEAALRRLEAMDVLTKIEIGFAHLRDKLYMERMEEVNKEGEMILEGTHPDLIHLSNLIENRREKKLKLVDKWFEQEEKQYERVAKSEEAATWNNWRNEVVELRKQMMSDAARKRRKLDREKRSLDGPRPARRHQTFETELIRNPDYDRKLRMHQQSNKKGKTRDENELGAYLAFPDLRGAADHESWMDMEQMGIAPDPRFIPGGFYRPEDVGMDPYGIYPVDQAAPGPTAAGYGPYGVPPAAEFAPYDRPYDNRGGQHAYVVDAYGRPLSPPPPPLASGPAPASHAFSNVPTQRGGNRPAQVETSQHHAHSSYSKMNRRSPPLPSSMDDRDMKHYNKQIDNPPNRSSGQRLHSPPPNNANQGVRPPSHYTKQAHPNSEEAFYHPPPGSKATTLPAPRAKIGASGHPQSDGYLNRHVQDHHYSR